MTERLQINDAMLYLGDSAHILSTLDANSVDSIVTDPPSGISFMNREWDSDRGGRDQWIAWMAGIAAECLRIIKPGGHALVWALPRTSHWTATAWEDAGWEVRDRIGHIFSNGLPKSHNLKGEWSGWGSSLKPAMEDWWLLRKPLEGTIAANVLRYGTGALNIDACRIGDARGRWPASITHDGSDEVLAAFPLSKGQQGAVTGREPSSSTNNIYGQYGGRPATQPRGDTGSAARFFFCSKASREDRGEGNVHPAVKNTRLMAYLTRLITPPSGVILDPFLGSGSTGVAALREGLRFVGIEREGEYFEIARRRIEVAARQGAFPLTPAA